MTHPLDAQNIYNMLAWDIFDVLDDLRSSYHVRGIAEEVSEKRGEVVSEERVLDKCRWMHDRGLLDDHGHLDGSEDDSGMIFYGLADWGWEDK